MTLLEEIDAAQQALDNCRNKLEKIQNYYDVPQNEMYRYYHIMKPKQAEKFIEGWVARRIGGNKIENNLIPDAYKQNDNGDIWVGNTLEIGKNNIELKKVFKNAGLILTRAAALFATSKASPKVGTLDTPTI